MAIGGEEVEVGMPLRVATDPAYQGRGIFAKLQAANEERVAEHGDPAAADGAERGVGARVPEEARLDGRCRRCGSGRA